MITTRHDLAKARLRCLARMIGEPETESERAEYLRSSLVHDSVYLTLHRGTTDVARVQTRITGEMIEADTALRGES